MKVLGSELVLLLSKFLLSLSKPSLLSLASLVEANGGQEWLEVGVEILRIDAEVPVKQEKELLLHEVDFGDGEPKVLETPDSGVPRPVLVLGRRVVEVLRRKDERGQEDPVNSTSHALGNRGQANLQPREIYERGHEGRDLDM